MKHRLIEGRLAYTSRKPGIEWQSRGFETFMFTRHADGKVTLRAHCEIDEPEPTVMRDIIYSIDYAFGPRQNPNGSLVESQSVTVKDGMKFYVTPTDKS